MRSPIQRKNAAKAAHGARGEQGENPPARWYSPMQRKNAAKAAHGARGMKSGWKRNTSMPKWTGAGSRLRL